MKLRNSNFQIFQLNQYLTNLKIIIHFSPIIFILSCLVGTEVENQRDENTTTRKGLVLNSLNKPAKNARVVLIPPNYIDTLIDNKPILVSYTNENGEYFFDSTIAGEYNILASLGKESVKNDSLVLNKKTKTLPTLELNRGINFNGKLQLGTDSIVHLPNELKPINISLAGTEYSSAVNSQGKFRFENVPSGKYEIILVTNTLAFKDSIVVKPVLEDSKVERDYLVYFEITTVDKISVNYLYSKIDSSTGTLEILWNEFDWRKYATFGSYILNFKKKNTNDNILYSDTAQSNNKKIQICKDSISKNCISEGEWILTVQVLDKNKSLGPKGDSLSIKVPEYNALPTFLFLEKINKGNEYINNQVNLNATWNEFSVPIYNLNFVNFNTGEVITKIDPKLKKASLSYTSNIPQNLNLGLIAELKNGNFDTLEYSFHILPESGNQLIYSNSYRMIGDTISLCGTCIAPAPEFKNWEWELENGIYIPTYLGNMDYIVKPLLNEDQKINLRATRRDGTTLFKQILIRSTLNWKSNILNTNILKWDYKSNLVNFFNYENKILGFFQDEALKIDSRNNINVYPTKVNHEKNPESNEQSCQIMDSKITCMDLDEWGTKTIDIWDNNANSFKEIPIYFDKITFKPILFKNKIYLHGVNTNGDTLFSGIDADSKQILFEKEYPDTLFHGVKWSGVVNERILLVKTKTTSFKIKGVLTPQLNLQVMEFNTHTREWKTISKNNYPINDTYFYTSRIEILNDQIILFAADYFMKYNLNSNTWYNLPMNGERPKLSFLQYNLINTGKSFLYADTVSGPENSTKTIFYIYLESDSKWVELATLPTNFDIRNDAVIESDGYIHIIKDQYGENKIKWVKYDISLKGIK